MGDVEPFTFEALPQRVRVHGAALRVDVDRPVPVLYPLRTELSAGDRYRICVVFPLHLVRRHGR